VVEFELVQKLGSVVVIRWGVVCGDEKVKCSCSGFQLVCWFFGVALARVACDRCLNFVYVVIHDGVRGFASTFGLCWFVGV